MSASIEVMTLLNTGAIAALAYVVMAKLRKGDVPRSMQEYDKQVRDLTECQWAIEADAQRTHDQLKAMRVEIKALGASKN